MEQPPLKRLYSNKEFVERYLGNSVGKYQVCATGHNNFKE